jgi:hypothetical protein
MLRGLQQRFRRNAADVHARAAQGLVPLDADSGKSKLSGADGGDVATRATAYDENIGVYVRHGAQIL